MARILKQSSQRREYELSRQSSGVGAGLFFLGSAIAGTFLLLQGIVTAELTCRKYGSALTQCTYTVRRLIAPEPPLVFSPIDNVRGGDVTVTREEYEDSDGDTQVRIVYRLFLNTNRSKTLVFRDDYLTIGEEARTFASQINTFASGRRETVLTLRADNRQLGIAGISGISLSTFVGVLLILRGTLVVVLRRTLILDRPTRRITCINKKMFSQTEDSYPFSSALVHVGYTKDSYDNVTYTAAITVPGGTEASILGTSDAHRAAKAAEELAEFLECALPPIPGGDVPQPSSPRQERIDTYAPLCSGQTKAATYRGATLSALPEGSSLRLVATDQELEEMGFSLVGELICDRHPTTSMFVYGGIGEGIAIVYDSDLSYEFFTEFCDGSSYTTSVMKTLIHSFPWLKIYRFSYPGRSLRVLWRCHQDRVAKSGKVVRPMEDLGAIALSLDRYLTRYDRIPLGGWVAVVNALYSLFS